MIDKTHDIRIKDLELENETLKNQVDTLKLALEEFMIGSNTLNIIFGI